MMVLLPFPVFAQVDNKTCSPKGYTVETINGVFTNEKEARDNKIALEKFLPPSYNNQPLTVDFLHNPSHLAGVGDVLMSVYQKIFDNETVEDYDLIEMLKSASEKVKTQKLLLVAHSQGNFYANSFYDTVAEKQGGVPRESIGVYSVATPASRVAGGGKWLTSDTDKVISGIVGRLSFKKIMTPNTRIELQDGDESAGHNFKDIYLKYRSAEIVSDIQASLNRLSENASQNENKSCLSAPELTLAHKIEGAVLAVADPLANTSSDAVALSVKTGAIASVLAYDTAVSVGTASVKATVWTYNTSLAVVKNVAQTSLAAASSLADVAKSLTNGVTNLTGNNSASVIVATQELPISVTTATAVKKQAVTIPSSVVNSVTNQQSIAKSPALSAVINTAIASEASARLATAPVKEPPPKLLFVGLRMSGGGASQKIEKVEIESVPEEELSAPTLSVPQCASSLATDGCLLATTTLRFEWTAVAGASYYALNKNGAHATTTETSLNIIATDFPITPLGFRRLRQVTGKARRVPK